MDDTCLTTTNNSVAALAKSSPPRNIPNDGGGGSGGGGGGGGGSIDHCDMTSMEIVNNLHLEIFPKQKTKYDDKSLEALNDLFPILNGEYIYYMGYSGKGSDEIVAITNFRIFLLMHKRTSFVNVPLMLIESIEFKEILYIYVYLKYAKTLRLTFSTSEKATLWYQRINSILSQPFKLEQLFAFSFYSWATNENAKCHFAKFEQTNLMAEEFKRMKFDPKYWRLSEANKKFELCPTYPELCVIPKCINDEQLKKIASFRSSKRFPAVVWRSKVNGSVIARSSQPNVGLLAWRMNEDELLLKAIADCCALTSVQQPKSADSAANAANGADEPKVPGLQDPMLLIIDARSRSVALANRVKGGGYEYSEYYTNCEIQFMNLENIHVIRSSFQSLKLLCQSTNDNKTFYSQLENSKWLHHLMGIIKAASTVVSAIDQQAKPVLIHCSDGWDRTPQILALAKILLDPYYRTINGFRTLIEVDWLMFGHKFAQRNGHAVNHNDTNERCPVFLQWLDCVYQVFRQTPSAFEFNETYLLKLCYHSYSCLFGTFLCDSCCDRVKENTAERTFSVWSYLNAASNREIVNYLYDDSYDDVIYPKCELNHMQLWHKLFCESEVTFLVQAAAGMSESTESVAAIRQQGSLDDEQLDNVQSHSIESTSSMSNSSVVATVSVGAGESSASSRRLDETRPIAARLPVKTKSYDDLSSSFKPSSAFMNVSILLNDDPHSHNSSLDQYTNLSITNGDPIPHRSSSESNLLLDALQTISTTSPKISTNTHHPHPHHHLLMNSIAFPSLKQQTNTTTASAETSHDTAETLVVNGSKSAEMTTDDHGDEAAESEAVRSAVPPLAELCASQLKPLDSDQQLAVQVQALELTDEKAAATTRSSTTVVTSLLLMQNSTETLVDEIQANGQALTVQVKPAGSEDEPPQPQIKTNGLKTPSVAQSSESSTPLSSSSTVPSPVSSTFNLKATTAATATATASSINCMSTSTSGLDDYVSMQQFPLINGGGGGEPKRPAINRPSPSSSSGQHILLNAYNRYCENMRRKESAETPSSSSHPQQQPYPTHHMSGLANLLTEMNQLPKWNDRKVSSSIPIKRNSDDKTKRRNKTIHDCIDIDGLTRIEDPTGRKVIERDEQNKKEIESLKEQLNKYKSFLSGLATNVQWQDIQNELTCNGDSTDKNTSDEPNQNQSYSFSNESVSSWDEIEEADCKWATWVPDYYVTHCQNCNNQFSYRLRKHHCRNCGLVFCYKCADQFYPLPNQNFSAPVRVCHTCKQSIDKQQNAAAVTMIKGSADGARGGGGFQAAFSSTPPPNFISSHFAHVNGSSPFAAGALQSSSKRSTTTTSNFSPSVSPFSTSPSTNFPFLSEHSQFNQQFGTTPAPPLATGAPPVAGSSKPPLALSNPGSVGLNNRCNQISSNKFKKNDSKSQKVSV